MAGVALSVRFWKAQGIADSDWLKLAPGVAVITGRNNVGKSRVLKAIAELPRITSDPEMLGSAPQVRAALDDSTVETDLRMTTREARAICPLSYDVYSKDGKKIFEIEWALVPAPGMPQLKFGPPDGPKQTGGYSAMGSSRGGGVMIPMVSGMTFLPGISSLLDAIGRLIYIPPERPVKAEHPANPVAVPRPDGSDLPQALYNHIGNKTMQMAALEKVFYEMFPEISDIMTAPESSGQIVLRFRDRFAKADISLDDVGTGLARMLHLIACVLLYPPGRVFLIDEPTTHLHPGAEKVLAGFLRAHAEHDYLISTHSPILINAIQPDRSWLSIRDSRGTVIQTSFSEQAGRTHVFQELGVSPGDLAIAERVLFVEGLTDRLVYPIVLRKLGWDLVATNCEVVDLLGAEVAHPLQQVVDQLASLINVRYLIYLDGDQRGTLRGDRVNYLPVSELEDIFLRAPSAIFAGFRGIIAHEHPEMLKSWEADWSAERIESFIKERRDLGKGKRLLISLAHEMKLEYRPPVYGPAVAEAMSKDDFEDLRKDFEPLFL